MYGRDKAFAVRRGLASGLSVRAAARNLGLARSTVVSLANRTAPESADGEQGGRRCGLCGHLFVGGTCLACKVRGLAGSAQGSGRRAAAVEDDDAEVCLAPRLYGGPRHRWLALQAEKRAAENPRTPGAIGVSAMLRRLRVAAVLLIATHPRRIFAALRRGALRRAA